MKTRLLLIFSLLFNICYSQQYYPFYTEFSVAVSDSHQKEIANQIDKLILNTIQDIANGKKALPNYPIYSASGYQYNWRYEMTQHEITLLELDKIQNFSTPNFSTYIKWNSKVDTGDVIGFSRLYNLDIYTLDNRTQKTKYIETKSTPPFTIALGNYDKIINNETLAKLTDLILSLIASKFNLSTSNGKYTSLTTVPFDSLDILRQVPSTQVKTLMTNIHNRLDCYIFADPFLKNKLTRKEYEEIQTKADTINSNIPVRSISLPKDIVIVEDWKILDAGRSNLKTTDPPLFKIVKNITAVGIKYDNDKMVYFDYSEIRNNRSVLNIYWPAFEELLRTLVTQKLEIKFYN